MLGAIASAAVDTVPRVRSHGTVRAPSLSTGLRLSLVGLLALSGAACGGDGAPSGQAGSGGGGAGGTTSSGGTTSAGGGGASSTGGESTGGSTGGATGGTTASGGTGGQTSPGSFWHLESPADSERTWLVSPQGERVFWLGVNTVMRDKSCDGMRDHWIRRESPTKTANVEWARMSTGQSGGQTVANPYCFNSVGAFSDTNDFDDGGGDSYMIRAPEAGGAGAPYGVVLDTGPLGQDRSLKDESGAVIDAGISQQPIGDPWNPAFQADLDSKFAAKVPGRKDDPRLQMWFADNEIGLFDRAGKAGEGVRDFRRWIWSDCPAGSSPAAPQCARHALAAFLAGKYGDSLAALNTAWQSAYPGSDFAVIVDAGPRPVPYVHDCNLACREDLQIFVHDQLLKKWIVEVTTRIRALDPNHLITSPRLAIADASSYRFWAPASGPSPDVWFDEPDTPVPTDKATVKYSPFDLFARDGNAGFDLIAVNVYTGDKTFEKPWFTDGIHKMQDLSGLPVVISEFSVRAKIDGWTNKGGANSFVPSNDAIDDQIQRGAYYQSQIDQFISFRGIVGASWHAWSDRYDSADPAHQINMGLVQCDDPARGFSAGTRWQEIDDRVAETNCNILSLIQASTGL